MDAASAAACVEKAGGKAAAIECPGRVFPVEISYRPLARRNGAKECAAAIEAILRNEISNSGTGDVLVFLPGRREIAASAGHLKDCGLESDFEIEPLHGSLPLAQQRRIIAPEQRRRRRVILSTNVAETGLTIPGIAVVIDSGLVRLQRFHIPSGMNRLLLEAASANSTEQRAGRAGRLGPGRCIRLWSKDEEWRPQETAAEIARIDIASGVLECLLWGASDPDSLLWPQPPPSAAWNAALELLKSLDAIDADCRPTETGRQIARMGLEPRLGRLCIAGRDSGRAALACAAAALLCERDDSSFGDDPDCMRRVHTPPCKGETKGMYPETNTLPKQQPAFQGGVVDFARRLSALRTQAGAPWAKRAGENAADLLKRLGLSLPLRWSLEDEADAGEMLAAAFPDRIAKNCGSGEGVFRFPSGREARINAPFSREEWLCALEVDSGERTGFIRLALALSDEYARAALERQAAIEKTIEWNKLRPRLVESKKAGRLLLAEHQRPCRRGEAIPLLPALLKEQGLSLLPWEEAKSAPRRLLERMRFFVNRSNLPGNQKAAIDDETLIASADSWLGPYIWGGADTGKGDIIDAEGLCNALIGLLGWDAKREMDKLAPDQFELPSGRKCPIGYDSGEPSIRIRLQDAFGISGGCAVMGVPVVFHLLSPANRPIQITRDLPGFWSGSYAEVRKEMRGRYPKHQW
jgi:ATP-dependent helicase HrpB